MNEQQKQLILKIGGGKSGFKVQEGGADYQQFQLTVADLEGLAAEGLITIREKLKESSTGHDYIYFVQVKITPEGHRWLAENQPQG
jgi:hypothetical protein